MKALPNYSIHPKAGESYNLRITDSIDQRELMLWVSQKSFLKHEKIENKLISRSKSNRTQVYMFRLPWHEKTVVMKVFEINPQFRITRKIELLLRNLVKKDYNKTAFEGVCALKDHGIPVANPLAFWEIYRGIRRKSYFLYEKVEKIMDGKKLAILLQNEQSERAGQCLDALLSKIVQSIRDIHKTGWRHGDAAPKNFLFDLPVSPAVLRPEDIERAVFYLIDFDGCSKVRIKIPVIKKFFDLKDLIKLKSLKLSFKDILKEYQRGKYSCSWYMALQFWLRGGFRWKRRFGRNSHRAHDSHLKKI